MSPISSMGSKFSLNVFKGKKSKTDAQAAVPVAKPQTPAKAPAATFDAAAPMAKNFRRLSADVDQVQRTAPITPTRIGLPSVHEVAIARRHSAPITSQAHLTAQSISREEKHTMSKPEREAYHALEIERALTPESPFIDLHLEPLPDGFDVKVPTNFSPAGKSILKKGRDFTAVLEALPRIDEKSALGTPKRQATVSSVNSINDEEAGGGRLSRTVSFDKHTEAHQAQVAQIKEQRELVTSFKRHQMNEQKRQSRRPTI